MRRSLRISVAGDSPPYLAPNGAARPELLRVMAGYPMALAEFTQLRLPF